MITFLVDLGDEQLVQEPNILEDTPVVLFYTLGQEMCWHELHMIDAHVQSRLSIEMNS